MKKLRLILLSAVLVAVFGFSFIGCSNDSSNGGSSNHAMTIQLKDASGVTYTYYADYTADDNYARGVSTHYEMKVFKSDGTEITDGSVSIKHYDEGWYRLIFNDEINRKVEFQTREPYKYTSSAKDPEKDTKKIKELSINGKKYTYVVSLG